MSAHAGTRPEKCGFESEGELLFTHFGLSGPLVLSASAHLRDFGKDAYRAVIDLKPALDEEKLDARLVRELSENANKDMQNVAGALVPRLMITVVLELSGIPPERKAHDVTKGERRRLLETLKGLTIPIKGPRPIAEAIITSGGIKVGEIDPKTMASKKIPGLFLGFWPGSSSTWTPTPGALTSRSPGPPAAPPEKARCFS